MDDFFNVNDAPLHIDVYCYGCKKLTAMSFTTEVDGRRYCHRGETSCYDGAIKHFE